MVVFQVLFIIIIIVAIFISKLTTIPAAMTVLVIAISNAFKSQAQSSTIVSTQEVGTTTLQVV